MGQAEIYYLSLRTGQAQYNDTEEPYEWSIDTRNYTVVKSVHTCIVSISLRDNFGNLYDNAGNAITSQVYTCNVSPRIISGTLIALTAGSGICIGVVIFLLRRRKR